MNVSATGDPILDFVLFERRRELLALVMAESPDMTTEEAVRRIKTRAETDLPIRRALEGLVALWREVTDPNGLSPSRRLQLEAEARERAGRYAIAAGRRLQELSKNRNDAPGEPDD